MRAGRIVVVRIGGPTDEVGAEMSAATVSFDLLNACDVKWLSRRTAVGDKKKYGVSTSFRQSLQVAIRPEPIDVKGGSFRKAALLGVDFANAGQR